MQASQIPELAHNSSGDELFEDEPLIDEHHVMISGDLADHSSGDELPNGEDVNDEDFL